MAFDQKIALFLGLPSYAPTLIGTALGLATLLMASVTIRCPSYKLSLAWFAISKQPSNLWLNWLLNETVCPR